MTLENVVQRDRNKVLMFLFVIGISILLGSFTVLQGSWLTVGALIVLVLMGLALAWPEAATLAFVFVLYLNVLAVASRFHNVSEIFAAAFTLVLAIPLVSYVIIKRQPLMITPALPWMLLYLVAMLISAILAESVNQASGWIQSYVLEGLLLYFLVSNVIRTPETLRRVVWALLLAGSIMGALSLYQELTHTYNNNYWGFAQVDRGGFKVSENIVDKVYRLRLAGPIGEKNRYAQVMLVLFPLALFRFWGEKSRILRTLALVAAGLCMCGVLLSFSRGAAVSMVGLLIITISWGYIKLRQAVVIFSTVIMLILVAAPDYITRMESLQGVMGIFDEEGASTPDGAIVGRETSNLAALYTFLDHPILGVGPGQYVEQYSQEYANKLGLRYFYSSRRAHNLYLETAADLGIVGLTNLLIIILITMYRLDRLRRTLSVQDPQAANMATAFLLGMIAFVTTSVFLHLSYQRYFWLLMALANCAVYIYERRTISTSIMEKAPANDLQANRTSFVPE